MPECLAREKTNLEHAWEIQQAYGLNSFVGVEPELAAWMTGDDPKAILTGAVAWLQWREALMPGITPLE
ncbi:DUF4158 domain-containing protein [Nocardia sp. NPDC004711]